MMMTRGSIGGSSTTKVIVHLMHAWGTRMWGLH